ncbi:glycoside hydrolase superfamily [Lineolata rhizophorae]|uniref:Beta-galactosidase n=1 Tax=Lineolata rhizophorae TaxID=578093 RepID=A0A6A6PCX1_9PEZI|nr:glycoside hydrolase superfamily [Lineolata rhizophorae]
MMINGTRLAVLSGEMHPWRMPVGSLWEDVFEKVRALGFNTVSFYVHWGIVEYKRGDIDFEGWRSLQPFIDAAKRTGLHLIARPGPYINAETTGGGTPGWGARVPGAWRTSNATYVDAMEGYVRRVSQILAEAQITRGGPIIMVQPENEYSYCFETPDCPVPWPQPLYMNTLQDLMREEGIVVPTISNEVVATSSNYAPGSGPGAVDIRGYDNYPLGFICNATSFWPDGALPTNYWELNHNISGGNPNSIVEMQAGAHARWGWFSSDDCADMTGSSFERVFYKNYISFSTMTMNLYMLYGGANWGGIASPATVTSYDYGGPIRESRMLDREKYSQLKLIAQFLRVSPAYYTTKPLNQYPVNAVNGSFTDNPGLAVTQLADIVGNKTVFWVLRHAAYNSLEDAEYKLQIPTSRGNYSIPTLGGSLRLNGRDSKIHVSDYEFGGNKKILYSSGEILTWQNLGSNTILVIHGFSGELHETAFLMEAVRVEVLAGDALRDSRSENGVVTINYRITDSQTVVDVGETLHVIVVNRNDAFEFWIPEPERSPAIVKSPYLIRSAVRTDATLALRGDLNQTQATIEVFAAPGVESATYNGRNVSLNKTAYGSLLFDVSTTSDLQLSLPSLQELDWKYINGLPELRPDFDDSAWPDADLVNSTNPRTPTTPTSLYSSDYGFHTGNILWRGHFTASGGEQAFNCEIQGGSAFSVSLFLDNSQLDYFTGIYNVASVNLTGQLPSVEPGSEHVITVLQDHMGLEQNYGPGGDLHKIPRGILNYNFTGSNATRVTWKLTGNLGGESYVDRVRGPLNEGGLYAERQGFHQPGVDMSSWESGSPLEGAAEPGVRFYSATFDLDIPSDLDSPIAFSFTNSTTPANYRCLLFVNGWQFGKYASNLGPQKRFPIPEGILNHRGENTVGLELWAMDPEGASLEDFFLEPVGVVETSMSEVEPLPQPVWEPRLGAY